MSGAGKSTIGRKLAEHFSYSFFDVDKHIEDQQGKRLQDVLEALGDEGFLAMEERTVLTLPIMQDTVISPGGSVVYSPGAMAFFKDHSTVVYLATSIEEIKKRTAANQNTRGIVGLKHKTIEEIFEERLRLYDQYAEITVATDGREVTDVVAEVMRRL